MITEPEPIHTDLRHRDGEEIHILQDQVAGNQVGSELDAKGAPAGCTGHCHRRGGPRGLLRHDQVGVLPSGYPVALGRSEPIEGAATAAFVPTQSPELLQQPPFLGG